MQKRISSILIAFMLMINSIGFVYAEGSVALGGMRISGGGLKLIGTISTTTAVGMNDITLGYIGWGLIVFGNLVGEGAQSLEKPIDRSVIAKTLYAEAKIAIKNPSAVNGKGIEAAANKFQFKDKGLSAQEKIVAIAQLYLEVQDKAKSLKKSDPVNAEVTEADLEKILGKNNTPANRTSLSKMFYLNGVKIPSKYISESPNSDSVVSGFDRDGVDAKDSQNSGSHSGGGKKAKSSKSDAQQD